MFSPSMAEPLATPSRAWMPKRARHDGELAALARTFVADWREGDRVMTWLRRHEGRRCTLSRLVADGWSWADISRAMHLAGITYRRTGEPIPAALLCRKAYAARSQVMKRSRKEEARVTAAVPPSAARAGVAGSAASPPLPPGGAAFEADPKSRPLPGPEEEPEFRPVSLAGWSGPTRRAGEETHHGSREAATPVPTGRAEAVISRLMSRK